MSALLLKKLNRYTKLFHCLYLMNCRFSQNYTHKRYWVGSSQIFCRSMRRETFSLTTQKCHAVDHGIFGCPKTTWDGGCSMEGNWMRLSKKAGWIQPTRSLIYTKKCKLVVLIFSIWVICPGFDDAGKQGFPPCFPTAPWCFRELPGGSMVYSPLFPKPVLLRSFGKDHSNDWMVAT